MLCISGWWAGHFLFGVQYANTRGMQQIGAGILGEYRSTASAIVVIFYAGFRISNFLLMS